MLESKFILDLLDMATSDIEKSALLKEQIPLLSVSEKEHTGIGVFMYFIAGDEIKEFAINDKEQELLDGVEIRNVDLNIFAEVILWLKNGIIDHIEIWNKNGKNFPVTDPPKYELSKA